MKARANQNQGIVSERAVDVGKISRARTALVRIGCCTVKEDPPISPIRETETMMVDKLRRDKCSFLGLGSVGSAVQSQAT